MTDLVGNSLDGNFTGAFPSGANGLAEDFMQNLGLLALQPPSITTFVVTPTATNDTGIVGDQNTNVSQPTFVGQVYVPFPGTVANLLGVHRVRRPASRRHHAGRRRRRAGIHGHLRSVGDDGCQRCFQLHGDLRLLPEGFQHVQAVVVGPA